MKDSIVGDPIFWPGLVYSPINIHGLLFALGTVTGEIGLLFEEFSHRDMTAICRRKTKGGWQRIRAAIAFNSSEFIPAGDRPDLLICWSDDAEMANGELPVLELSRVRGRTESGKTLLEKPEKGLDGIFPRDPTDDLLHRGEVIAEFEETISQLDERIKKLKRD